MQTTREEHCLYPTSVAPFLSFSWIGCTTNILEIKLNDIEDENWFDKVIVDILDWQRLWLTRRHFFFWTLKYKPFYSISVTTKAKRRRPAWIRVVYSLYFYLSKQLKFLTVITFLQADELYHCLVKHSQL